VSLGIGKIARGLTNRYCGVILVAYYLPTGRWCEIVSEGGDAMAGSWRVLSLKGERRVDTQRKPEITLVFI